VNKLACDGYTIIAEAPNHDIYIYHYCSLFKFNKQYKTHELLSTDLNFGAIYVTTSGVIFGKS